MIVIKIIGAIILFFLVIVALREVWGNLKYEWEKREEDDKKDFFENFCIMTTRQHISELTEQEKYAFGGKFALIVNSLRSGNFNYRHRKRLIKDYLRFNHRSRILYGIDFIHLGEKEMRKILKEEFNRNFCCILGIVALLISLVYGSLLIGSVILAFGVPFLLIGKLKEIRDDRKYEAKTGEEWEKKDFFEMFCIMTTGYRISELTEQEKHIFENKFALVINSLEPGNFNYKHRERVVRFYVKLNDRSRSLYRQNFIDLVLWNDMREIIEEIIKKERDGSVSDFFLMMGIMFLFFALLYVSWFLI